MNIIRKVQLGEYLFDRGLGFDMRFPRNGIIFTLSVLNNPSNGAKDYVPVPCDDGSHQYAFPAAWQCVSCLLELTDGFLLSCHQ